MQRDQITVEALSDLLARLVDVYDVVDVLNRIADYCTETLQASAAGIMLLDQQGRLRLLAASSESARLLELFQQQTLEGPCLDCVHTGEPVSADLETAEGRWPRFAPAARHQGFRHMHALPLRFRGETLGGLALFAQAQDAAAHNARVAQALADVVVLSLMRQPSADQTEEAVHDMRMTLHARVTIEQAKGMIAEAAGISMGDAFLTLRDYARSHQLNMTDTATALVDRTFAVHTIVSAQR